MTGVFLSAPMSDKVTISINELRALLRKAFEGVFGHSRDWNAMTDTVIWLECHGMAGLKYFFDCYSSLSRGHKAKMSIGKDGDILIDPQGTSSLEYMHLLADVMLAAAKNNGAARARISTVKYPNIAQVAINRFSKLGYGAKYTVRDNETVVEIDPAYTIADKRSEPFLNVLNNGCEMDRAEYLKLCRFADKVLVPATEQSRRGAGE